MKRESFEEFINRVSDGQHQGIDNYDGFMTNLRRYSECKEMQEIKKAKRLAIISMILCGISIIGVVIRIVLRLKGV